MKSHGAKYKKNFLFYNFSVPFSFKKKWKKIGKKSGKSEDVVSKKKKGAGVKKGLSALNLISGKIIYLIR